MQLRPYQSRACDAGLSWLRTSIDPALIDAAPAAGKSFMIAYIAHQLIEISGGKRVLVLQPDSRLVKQNYEKFAMTGEPASIFSASAGVKSTRHKVVFGTAVTVKNSISRFMKDFCAVIVDEAHGITPTIKGIIDTMRKGNPNLRVLGLSGTPYRLGDGYIFRMWPDDRANGDDTCRDPYFVKCVYRVPAKEMLDEGFITPMVIGQINTDTYDVSGLHLQPNGKFLDDDVERAFVGHGRKTAAIVADAIEQARSRPGGVMYFAATVRHAMEIYASLPPDNSAVVVGDSGQSMLYGKPASEDAIISAYRAQKVRHLVSVGKLTTGFDVSHTETIVLMRFTESPALLQQILGRAWRLHDGKDTSLLLDYAKNVEEHFPDGDIYNPIIKAGKIGGDGEGIEAQCPDCGHVNQFSLNMDYADYQRNVHGYCLDTFGETIMTEHGPLSAHYGRRCFGMVKVGLQGQHERCSYRWSGKECEHCGEVNDIAARYCYVCKGELVDPNDKLASEFKSLKRDPHRRQVDRVLSMQTKPGISAKGNKTLRVDFVTEYRQFSICLLPEATNSRQHREYADFMAATFDGTIPPKTVGYVKDEKSQFWRILCYDAVPDDAMLPAGLETGVKKRDA